MAGALIPSGLFRTSTLVIGVVFSAVLFERYFDPQGTSLFRRLNKGKLYADIKEKYEDP